MSPLNPFARAGRRRPAGESSRENDYTVCPEARQIARAAPLVLASRSPRRRALLRRAGVPFETLPARADERPRPGEPAEAVARRLALEKARIVARGLRRGLALGADTVVVLDGRPLGKPSSRTDARRMLRRLSGRTHRVVTALALVSAGDRARVAGLARSSVRFAPLRERDVRRYVASREPMDKAGGYAIQGRAGKFVTRVWGSESNVVGMPMPLLSRLLVLARRRGLLRRRR